MAMSPTDPMVIGAAVTALLLVAAAVFFMKKKKGKAGKAAEVRPTPGSPPLVAPAKSPAPSKSPKSPPKKSPAKSPKKEADKLKFSSPGKKSKSPPTGSAPRRSRHRHRVRAAFYAGHTSGWAAGRGRGLYTDPQAEETKKEECCVRERRSGAERRAGLWPVALERGSADVCVCARACACVCACSPVVLD